MDLMVCQSVTTFLDRNTGPKFSNAYFIVLKLSQLRNLERSIF